LDWLDDDYVCRKSEVVFRVGHSWIVGAGFRQGDLSEVDG